MKAKLGQKMAANFFQGAAEVILHGQPPPTIVEPSSAQEGQGRVPRYR